MGGFTAVPNGALIGLSANEQLVLLWLYIHFNRKTKACHPSLKTLRKETTFSRPTLIKTIKSLEEVGRIKAKRVNGVNTSYEILPILSTSTKEPVKLVYRGGKAGLQGVVKGLALNGGEPYEYNQMKEPDRRPLKKSSMTPIKKILEKTASHEEIRVDDITFP